MSSLWKRWLLFTMRRAHDMAERDRELYGRGYVQRKWWGWHRLPPFSMYVTYSLKKDDRDPSN